MIIGAMNNPAREVTAEIQHFGRLGLDFVDLTLEPPAAATWRVDPREIRASLEATGLSAVGHTAFYLPIGSPFESLRRAACDELGQAIGIFATLGVRWVNVHADGHAPMHEEAFILERNLDSLRWLVAAARDAGVGLMLENTPGRFNSAETLGVMLEALPELGLHLDIGHCHLQTEVNTADEILRRFASRLRHVHIHDNKGGWGDLHLPLGCGTLDARRYLPALRRSGYEGTITLEVFTRDPHFLRYSCDRVREWWDEPVEPELKADG